MLQYAPTFSSLTMLLFPCARKNNLLTNWTPSPSASTRHPMNRKPPQSQPHRAHRKPPRLHLWPPNGADNPPQQTRPPRPLTTLAIWEPSEHEPRTHTHTSAAHSQSPTQHGESVTASPPRATLSATPQAFAINARLAYTSSMLRTTTCTTPLASEPFEGFLPANPTHSQPQSERGRSVYAENSHRPIGRALGALALPPLRAHFRRRGYGSVDPDYVPPPAPRCCLIRQHLKHLCCRFHLFLKEEVLMPTCL